MWVRQLRYPSPSSGVIKAMTIAAGFCVDGGVLTCADTEHSGTGFKTYESKILVTKSTGIARAVFSYSGHYQLARSAIFSCTQRVEHLTQAATCDEVAHVIQEELLTQYDTHIGRNAKDDSIYQLIFSVWVDGNVKLYSTWQGCVYPRESYACIGIGEHVTNYLLRPIFKPNMPVLVVRGIAAHAIGEAKKTTEGVGGETLCYFMKTDGQVEELAWTEAKSVEGMMSLFYSQFRTLTLFLLAANDQQFADGLEEFKKQATWC